MENRAAEHWERRKGEREVKEMKGKKNPGADFQGPMVAPRWNVGSRGTAPRCRRQAPVVAPESHGGAGVQWWRRGCSGGAEV